MTSEEQLAAFDPVGFTHRRADLIDSTDDARDVPLCFVGEARRTGATAVELNLTFDRAWDIEDFPRTDDATRVSCPDCLEWMRS